MPDPTPHHRRSPMDHERDAGLAVDTSPEAVEWLAEWVGLLGQWLECVARYEGASTAGLENADLAAATLRALAAERDALISEGSALAAGQCLYDDGTGLCGDEHGSQYCAMKRRAERAEAALAAAQSDAAAARKRVQQLIADFNRQVERTDEQRAAYEARMQEMETDRDTLARQLEALKSDEALTAVHLSASRTALLRGIRLGIEAAAEKSDEIAHRHWQAGVDLATEGQRDAMHLASYTSRCVDDVSAAIRALDPAAIAAQVEKGAGE